MPGWKNSAGIGKSAAVENQPPEKHNRLNLSVIAAGLIAGLLVAYLEALHLLYSIGTFLVDIPFLLKTMLLYGVTGAVSSLLVYNLIKFALRVFKKRIPGDLPALLFSAMIFGGITLAALVNLFDLDIYREVSGGLNGRAWLVLAAAFSGALLVGLLSYRFCIYYFGSESKRRKTLISTALLLSAAVFAAPHLHDMINNHARKVKTAAESANVIILVLDALRPDHLSSYGYQLPTSPGLDALAAAGLLFEQCYAPSNWTVPTHASLFSGLYPSSHGLYTSFSEPQPNNPNLPEILTRDGYRSASIFDNRLLGEKFGLGRGFEKVIGVNNEHKVSPALIRLRRRFFGERSQTPEILDLAEKWIKSGQRGRRPFFLFSNLMDTHLPYRPKQPYADEFIAGLPAGDVNRKLVSVFTTNMINDKHTSDKLVSRLSPLDWLWLERVYDSNIRFLDQHISSFLEKLESAGILENTIVIITSDHGEFFSEEGLGGHFQASMHNAGLRVPLIINAPGIETGRRISHPVSLVDVFPTLLNMLGRNSLIPDRVQGADLLSTQAKRGILAEFWLDEAAEFIRAFFWQNFKLVVGPGLKLSLFDLETDPQEKNDLSCSRPDKAARLFQKLQEKLAGMPPKKHRESRNPEVKRALKSLGYL